MRAVEEFTLKEGIAQLSGWVVAGASKRGWTTWLVGAVTCPTCPNIVGIAPLVPIVPDLLSEVHRQWMSYGGFTFAFNDYVEAGLITELDGEAFGKALKIIDPVNYLERLERLPKLVVLSSDDEFMQMDWSDIWWQKLTGEKHLLIAPNSEHSLSTGIPEVISHLVSRLSSLQANFPLIQ